MKNKCEITGGLARTYFKLPCHLKKEINLNLLEIKTKESPLFELRSTIENCPGHVGIGVTMNIENFKVYMNVYATGKAVVTHNMKIKALHHLIDFVYYYLIEDCLNE